MAVIALCPLPFSLLFPELSLSKKILFLGVLVGYSRNCISAYYVGSIICYCCQTYLDVVSYSFLQMLQDRSNFWECYIWATTSEVLGREAAARGSKRRPDWFNLTKCPPLLQLHGLNTE